MHPIYILGFFIPLFVYNMIYTILHIGKPRDTVTHSDAAWTAVISMLMIAMYLWLLHTYGGG
jgi:hypothetical protein